MAWRSERTRTSNDLVWEGVETGIAPSPTMGTANIQNANISTSTGEIMASYGRTAQTPEAITNGTLTPDGATNFTGPANLKVGQWVSVSASTVTSISTTTTPTTVAIDYLIVGGGGGGGANYNEGAAGGGGAGEYVSSSGSLAVGAFKVTVGAGGAGGSGLTGEGNDGASSILETIDTAVGGGGGGFGPSSISPATSVNGRSGASGGGGGATNADSGTGGSATAGNAGGAGFASATSSLRAGGGGGGSGGAGTAGASANAGEGGNGTSNSITGTAVIYAGGGGGGAVGTAGEGGDAGISGGNGGDQAAGQDGKTPGSGGGGASSDTTDEYSGGRGADGIVIISYTTGACIAYGGTVSYNGTKTVHTFTQNGAFVVVSIPQTNLYYVSYKSGTTYKLSAKFDPTGANALTHGTTGSVTFSTVAVPNQAIAKATEEYTTSTGVEFRYYILDANSRVWMYDSYIYQTYGTGWMLPDPGSYTSATFTGMGVLNGNLIVTGKQLSFWKPTVNLGGMFRQIDDSFMNDSFPNHKKFAFVGKQGKLYYCDGNYIGEIFPTTSFVTSEANVQSMCSYTATTTTGTVSSIVTGSLPYLTSGTRVPVVFFTDVYGTQPTNLSLDRVYYIQYFPGGNYFNVYPTATSTESIDIASGAAGNQYFTTFWPSGSYGGASGSAPLVQVTTQRVNIPTYETTQCMVEVGNTVLIGCNGSTLYPWNQIDATPSDAIELPEADVKTMINVNNMAYVFAGNKGNIYVSNNAVASLTLKVPDYCAGVPGTPNSYIEPYFTWGDATYLRGRVYFSILDQTATKAGNCGGIWSFIPSQNIDPNQNVGSALRLENQNSYGDYDGYATILIANEEQNTNAPQYWAAWQDSYNTATAAFGIDQSATTPVTQYVVETDIVPTGTMLEKQTFAQLEYKLMTPLATGDSVQLYYRLNATDAWATCGTVREETDKIAGYFDQTFQKTQWVQFRAVITTPGTTASSFVRLKQIRLR